MTGTSCLLVAGGGALGAFCRFQLSAWCAAWFGQGFAWGTLACNVLGCFVMGALAGAVKAGLVPLAPWHDLIAEGLLGALTTFSTFSMDTFAAFRDGHCCKGWANLLVSMALCLAAVAGGFSLLAG